MDLELDRQRNCLEMIASENFLSADLISASGNPFTNKYAEGLPAKRYYGGCEYVDDMENLAISRACKLFNANFANVQPHSGANANLSVMLALLHPGDTILGLDLAHGGHLTHGSLVNFSGKLYKSQFYQLDQQTQRLNYQHIDGLAKKHKPKLIIAGGSAYPRSIDFDKFSDIAKSNNAYLLVDMAHIAGLVACGLHPSPIEYADVVTSTTHKTLRGPRGGLILWNDPKLSAKINKGVFPGTQGGPLEHTIAIKAGCFFQAMQPEFARCQAQTIKNAQVFAHELVNLGKNIVSGGTDNHIVLLSLLPTDISGKELQFVLDTVGITANKNTIPFDQRSPFDTSGVRFGTPAISSRGMVEEDMKLIAKCVSGTIDLMVEKKSNDRQFDFTKLQLIPNQDSNHQIFCQKLIEIKSIIGDLCRKYPLYRDF